MEHIETIAVGVFVGVLTAVLLSLVKKFWVKVVVPFWQQLRYQGADISGVWDAHYKDRETETSLSLVLRQSAHDITGSMHFSTTNGDLKETIDFHIKGTYWENYLTLSAQSKDKKVFSGGVMYLKSVSNGFCLDGYFSFRDSNTDSVTSPKILFKRT